MMIGIHQLSRLTKDEIGVMVRTRQNDLVILI
jgi:hypothetical protein